jgi:hypothetical protein
MFEFERKSAMSAMRWWACLAAVTLLATPVSAASKHRHHPSSGYFPATPPQPGDEFGYQGGRYCPRMCAEDRNPCDPIDFKLADGRCDPD